MKLKKRNFFNKKYIWIMIVILLVFCLYIGFSYLEIRLSVSGDVFVDVEFNPCKDVDLLGRSMSACIDNVRSEYVTATNGINFSSISSSTNGQGLYIKSGTENDTYPVYYFRGNVINNNIIFAGFCWKIVRTTETGGTKLIYSGEIGTGNICNKTNVNSELTNESLFNSSANDSKYVGYTYDTTNTSSTIKNAIDSWYKANVLNKYDSYLEDVVFCNDRSLSRTNGTSLYYGALGRLETNKTPSLECPQQSDKYTVKETSSMYNRYLEGNKLLDYPVALLTADEASFAGAVYGVENRNYYLYNGHHYWLLSPYWYHFSTSSMFIVGNIGSLSGRGVKGNTGTSPGGVRPVVSLKAGVKVSVNGNGTSNNPYVVV